MKKLFKLTLASAMLLAAVFGAGCAEKETADSDYTVRILLAEGEGYEFLGSRIVDGDTAGELSDSRVIDAKPGQTVQFAYSTEEDIILECENESVSFADGYITVENAQVPMTLEVTARVGDKYFFAYNTNNKSDTVTSTHRTGSMLLENTEVTLKAEIPEGQRFLGFSTGNFVNRGGKLVTEEAQYTFDVTDTSILFANYADFSEWKLTYDVNGGVQTDSASATVTDVVKDSFYYCPNTRPDKEYFTRDGYVLVGYNTEPDGSGDYYGLGWNVIMPENGEITLYCQWAKEADESDFVYERRGSGVAITDYLGDDEVLIIPKKLGGFDVKNIMAEAFSGDSFTEVFIPRTVTSIARRAFVDCTSLVKLNLTDNVTQIFDDSFVGCTEFSTIAPQAVRDPGAVSMTNFTHAINYERLITRENDIMLIVSGSTNIYGLTASNLEKALDNEWDVITYATVASTPNTMYAEIGLHYLDGDDLLIFAPEASPDGHQWGTNYWKDQVWGIFEGAYDAISLVDIRNYTKVFSSFATYNNSRSRAKHKTYEDHLEHFNEYGEHITYHAKGNITDPWIRWKTDVFFTEENVNNFNRVLDDAASRGIPTLIGWMACATEHTLMPDAKDRANQEHYMSLAAELYHAPFFGDLADYMYPEKYVYDSAMHITSEGSVLRTEQMIKDIKAVLSEIGLFTED